MSRAEGTWGEAEVANYLRRRATPCWPTGFTAGSGRST